MTDLDASATPVEKLLWLQDNTVSVILECSPHAANYESIEDHVRWHEDITQATEDEKIDVAGWESLWSIQCYPHTPIGSYHLFGQTFHDVVGRMYTIISEVFAAEHRRKDNPPPVYEGPKTQGEAYIQDIKDRMEADLTEEFDKHILYGEGKAPE